MLHNSVNVVTHAVVTPSKAAAAKVAALLKKPTVRTVSGLGLGLRFELGLGLGFESLCLSTPSA